MQPLPDEIQKIAMYDAIAAYGLYLGVPRTPVLFNLAGSFSSFALGQPPITANLSQPVSSRTWIEKMNYSLSLPNVFAGNILKTLYDAQLKAHPGINAQLIVFSGPRYPVGADFTPLENIVDLYQSRWPAGWPLFKQQSLQAQFVLTDAQPTSDPNAPPYNVVLTLTGWQFLDTSLDDMSSKDAGCCLRAAGFHVPEQFCLRG